MKKLPILFALTGLLFFGCQDLNGGGIVGPDNTVAPASNSVSFLKFPASLEPRPMHKKIPFLITPQDGGKIEYKDKFMSVNGEVSINVKLTFPKGAVNDSMIVSVDVEETDVAGSLNMDFGPSPTTFNIPALLDFSVEGLDPNSLPIDASTIELVYDNNGTFIPMNVKKIKVNTKDGKIQCEDGEIPHFSRYAWATKQ